MPVYIANALAAFVGPCRVALRRDPFTKTQKIRLHNLNSSAKTAVIAWLLISLNRWEARDFENANG